MKENNEGKLKRLLGRMPRKKKAIFVHKIEINNLVLCAEFSLN